MAAPSRTQVLALYRMLLRESSKFPSYNYRTYALRRVRDAFRENQNVEDPKVLEQLLNKAHDSLAIIKRQVTIGKMYEAQPTVVESTPKKFI
ncbi:LYR motif-containing protein 4 [Neoarius graeffei]|uniref:LYR motif-containing protein 4 n=1 Tax=Neoarius graeffei TaxID=443677 RepID=UPI00298D573A|nr:LYR motif-containing protein 4 [Neoarius graeffei]